MRVRDNSRPCAGRQFYASSDEPYPGLVVGTGVEDYFDSSYYLRAPPPSLPYGSLTLTLTLTLILT